MFPHCWIALPLENGIKHFGEKSYCFSGKISQALFGMPLVPEALLALTSAMVLLTSVGQEQKSV
jgi:hypothetical protein